MLVLNNSRESDKQKDFPSEECVVDTKMRFTVDQQSGRCIWCNITPLPVNELISYLIHWAVPELFNLNRLHEYKHMQIARML